MSPVLFVGVRAVRQCSMSASTLSCRGTLLFDTMSAVTCVCSITCHSLFDGVHVGSAANVLCNLRPIQKRTQSTMHATLSFRGLKCNDIVKFSVRDPSCRHGGAIVTVLSKSGASNSLEKKTHSKT